MRTKAQRARDRMARNYGVKGGEADRVRATECIVATAAEETGQPHAQLLEHGWTACGGLAGAHHAEPRQMGGAGEGRMRLFSACARHGAQAGEGSKLGKVSSQRLKFERLYGVDVGASADRIALSHEPPLGVRGLAARWGYHEAGMPAYGELSLWLETTETPEGYDLAALLGWVRRRMAAELVFRRTERESLECEEFDMPDDDDDRDALALAVSDDLGIVRPSDGDLAMPMALCELAGWPS